MVSHSAIGEEMAKDKRVPDIHYRFYPCGKRIGGIVTTSWSRIPGTWGNNAIIVSEHADIDMVVRGAVFELGYRRQRCTSIRRLIVHESVYDAVKDKMTRAYAQLKIGDPLDQHNHVGPLIDTGAVKDYLAAMKKK